MRKKGSAVELEAIRLRAAELLRERRSSADVAHALGVSFSSVKRWRKAWESGGKAALAAKPHPGNRARLSHDQKQQLVELLRRGAVAAGYANDLWTCPRVAELVQKIFGVQYHPDHLGRILHDLGFTPQRPRVVARERDEATIKKWRRYVWPRIKKTRELGANIVFLDEFGFRLQPVNRRTWAPRGQTPVQRAWDRHDRLSVISAISMSPQRQHMRLAFRVQSENVRTPHVVDFIQQLQSELRQPLIVVMDRLPAHRSAAWQSLAQRGDRIQIEWLPGYAPELNPVEYSWSHAKYAELANFVPHDSTELQHAVYNTLMKQRKRHSLLRSFFHAAKLKL